MKKLILMIAALSIATSTLSAGGIDFGAKKAKMLTKINKKIKKNNGNDKVQEFLSKKKECVNNSRTGKDLKKCKKDFNPKDAGLNI
jgi:hypothetical protein